MSEDKTADQGKQAPDHTSLFGFSWRSDEIAPSNEWLVGRQWCACVRVARLQPEKAGPALDRTRWRKKKCDERGTMFEYPKRSRSDIYVLQNWEKEMLQSNEGGGGNRSGGVTAARCTEAGCRRRSARESRRAPPGVRSIVVYLVALGGGRNDAAAQRVGRGSRPFFFFFFFLSRPLDPGRRMPGMLGRH